MKNVKMMILCAALVLMAGCKESNDPENPKSIKGNQSAPAWTAQQEYDLSTSMTAVVSVDLALSFPKQVAADGWQLNDSDLLAAFSGDSCLALQNLQDGLFYLFIVAPETEEQSFSLRYYSATMKNTFVSKQTTVFQNDAHLGNVNEPYKPTFRVE